MADRLRLPASVQEIANEIGRERALFLVGSLPQAGTRTHRRCLYVPKTITPAHPLVAIIGWEAAQKLVRAFTGMILQPGHCENLKLDHRDRRIREMRSQNIPVAEIALAMGISKRRVVAITKEEGAANA